MANPANTAARTTQDERIPGLPVLPAGTNAATLTVPVYNTATDRTHQAPLGGPVPTTNVVPGGAKVVQYRDSRLYGVPAGALTLDRLNPLTIAPGTLATVDNPADQPLTVTKPPQQYVATVVAAGTAGAVAVPRYIGAAAGDEVLIVWQEEVPIWKPVDALEVPTSARGVVGLGLHDAIVWLANHLGQGVTPTPVPTITGFMPMSGAQGSTVVLAGTNFTGATQVSINSAVVASFTVDSATQITAVLTTTQATGKVRVTTPAGTAVSSADFTVTMAGPGTDQLIPFVDSDFANSVRYPDANTLSPFATATLSTNSPYLDLDVSCAVQNAGHGDYQALAVYVNGVYDGTTTSGAARTTTRYTFAQAPAGQVTVQLVTSGQERPQDQNDAAGSILYSAQGAPGTATSKVAVVRKSKRIYVFGDSLCNGIGTNPSQLYAWVRVFLAAHPDYEICVEGSGWHSASRSYQTTALRQAAADRALAYLAGTTEAHTIQMLSANDFLQGWGTAADVSAYMGDLADKIHAGRSSVVVHVSTGLNIAPAKASGWESYRSALRGLNNSQRNTWLRIIEGTNLVDVSKVSGDGVHYTAAGYADEAANIFTVLSAAPTGPVIVPPVDAGTMVTTLDAAANSYWEVQNSEYTNYMGTYPALTIVLEMELPDYSKNQFLFAKQVSVQTASDRTLGIYLFNSGLYAEFFANSVRYELSIPANLLSLVGSQRYVVAFRYNPQGVTLFCNNQQANTANPGADLAVSSTPIRFGSVLSGAGAGLAYTYGVLRNVSILTRSYSDAEITTLRGNRGVLSSSQLAEAATLGSWPLTRKDASSPLSLNLVSGASPVQLMPRPSAVIPAGATVQENDARITTTGTWQIYNSGDSYAGSRQYVNGNDEGAKSFTTTATVLTLRNQVAPYCGELGIYVDGSLFATWNQYAGSEQVGSFTTPPMPAGTKQVELRKTTAGGAYLIIIDQLEFS